MLTKNIDQTHSPAPREHLNRVLVIESHLNHLQSLVTLLREEGFEAKGAISFQDACVQMEHSKFSVIIFVLHQSDHRLFHTGSDLEKLFTEIPTIIYPVDGSFDSAKEALNAGAFAYVEQSQRPEALLNHVHRAVRHNLLSYLSNLEDSLLLQRHTELLLRHLVEGTAATIGAQFFHSLVKHLSQCLDVRYAFVVECIGPANTRGRVIASWRESEPGHPQEYAFKGTPCEQVLKGVPIMYPDSVQSHFPQDTMLANLGIESYLGMPLFDHTGSIIGLLSVLDVHPMTNGRQKLSIMKIFAARAAAELEHDHTLSALKNVQDSLEHRVAERTAQLTRSNAQLRVEIAERKEAENALRESEHRYRALYDDNPTMYFTVNAEGIVLSVNRFGASQLGYTPEELRNRSVFQIIAPSDIPLVRHHFGLLLRNPSEPGHWRFRKVRKNGSLLWVQETARVVRSHQGDSLVLIVCEDVTERKDAEKALLLARFSIDRSPDAIFWSTEDAKLLDVNEAACHLLGYSKKKLLTMRVHDFAPESTRTAWPGTLAHLKDQGALVFETALTGKDGTTFPIEVTANFFEFEGEGFVCSIARDIRERKQAEVSLRTSEQAIRELYAITSSNDCSFEERIQAILELGCRRFNLTHGFLTRQTDQQLEIMFVHSPHPEFSKGKRFLLCGSICEEVFTGERPMGFEHASQTRWRLHPGVQALQLEAYLGTKVMVGTVPYGTLCFSDTRPHSAPFSEADKNFLQLIARWIGGELERRMTEEALRKNHSLLNTILAETTDAIFVKDREGRYLHINDAGAKFLDKSVREVIGKDDTELFDRDSAQQIIANDRRIMTEGNTFTFEEHLTAAGHTRSYSAMKTPYRDNESNIIGLIGISRDITERKQAEEAVYQAHARLQALSHQLLKVQENERRQLARDLHDEIGQTLTAIKMNLQTLQRARSQTQVPGLLSDSLNQLDYMLKHVRELSLDLHPSLLDDLGLVPAIRWYATRQAERAGWKLNFHAHDLPSTFPPEFTIAVYRFIQEALTNVMRHAQANRVALTLRLQGSHFTIVIQDDGIGFQVDTAIQQAACGQSLGLLGMQERIDLVSGTVTFHSTIGKGTRVVANLPCAVENDSNFGGVADRQEKV